MRRLVGAGTILLLGVLLPRCGPVESPAPEETSPQQAPAEAVAPQPAEAEALAAEWVEFAHAFMGDQSQVESALDMAKRLAFMGPGALDPLIDVLADPESGPYAKVLTVQCVAPHMSYEYLSKLTPLAKSENDVTTRACAVALIGQFNHPDVLPILREFLVDSERRVWFSALLGLTHNGDAPSQQRLVELYAAPETLDSEKIQIVESLLEHPDEANADFLATTLIDPDTMAPVCQRIAQALGRVGNTGSLDALRQAQESGGETLREIVQTAIAAIEERMPEDDSTE